MLISRAKARDLRGGSQELIVLVPELCRATGYWVFSNTIVCHSKIL